MDKKPTQEQIKEFWEWCGCMGNEEDGWFYPDGNYHSKLPEVNLNNLFKYAVPKLNWWIISSGVMNYVVAEVRVYPEIGIAYKSGKSEGYIDPALALFWAIWEVIHGS